MPDLLFNSCVICAFLLQSSWLTLYTTFLKRLLCRYSHGPLSSASADNNRSLKAHHLGVKAGDFGKIPYIY